MNCLPRILLVSLLFSTTTPSFSYDIKLDNKTIAYAGAAALAIGGISYAIYQTCKTPPPSDAELLDAVLCDDSALVIHLLEKGANANALFNDHLRKNWTPLMIATCYGNVTIAKALIAHGAQVNAKTTFGNSGNSALILAALEGDNDMVELLLAHGADIEGTGHNNATPLIYAAHYANSQVVSTLLKHGANINAQDEKGNTALIYAVNSYINFLFDDFVIIEALIKHGADITIKNIFGKTALDYAQEKRITEYAEEKIITEIVELLKTQNATK